MVSSLVRLFSIQACAWAMQDDGRGRPSRRSGRSTVEKFLEAKTELLVPDEDVRSTTTTSPERSDTLEHPQLHLEVTAIDGPKSRPRPPGNASREGAHKMLTGTDAISGPGEPGRGRIVTRFRRQNVCQCLVLEPDLEVAVCHNGRGAAFLS